MGKQMRITFMVLNLGALVALVGWYEWGRVNSDLAVQIRLTELDRAGCFDLAKLKESHPHLADPRSVEMREYLAGPRKEHEMPMVWGGAALTLLNIVLVLIASWPTRTAGGPAGAQE